MNRFFSVAAFAAAVSAAALRRGDMSASCGFQIQSSGGVDATMGQFEDGQNRLNGSYSTATYYFSDGGITDQAGRPCIVTTTDDATHQFQCDENSPGGPTLGFSIASNGSILFNGNDQFYACPYITEYNIYTQWLQGQDKCRPIKLSTNSTCAAGSGGPGPSPSSYSAGYSAPPYPVSFATIQQTVPGTGVVPGHSQSSPVSPLEESTAVPGYGRSSSIASATTVPVVPGYGESSSSEVSPVASSRSSIPNYGSETTAPAASSIPSYVGESSSIETSPVQSIGTAAVSISAYSVGSSSPVESSPVESTGIESYGTPAVSIPAPSSPTGPADVTVTQTVYTSDCETTTTEVVSGTTVTSVGTTQSYITSVYSETAPQETASRPASVPESSAPGVPGYGITTPVESSPGESATTGRSVSTSAPQQSIPYPAPSSSSSKPSVSKPVESSPVESTSPAGSSSPVSSYPPQGPSTVPVQSTSQETTCTKSTTVPAVTVATPSASASCAPAGSTDSQGRYSCNPAHQYPAGQTCLSENGCYYLRTSSLAVSSAQTPVPTAPVSVSTTSEAFGTTTRTGSVSSAPPSTFATSSVPSKASSSVPSGTKPAEYLSSNPSSATAASSTTATATACQTSLTDAYQTPHLINWVSKDYPEQSYGSQLNATINEDCSSLFTFDIPADYKGKQCSVIFLLPKQEDLETSAWSWNEQGSIEFSQLSSAATEQTTYNTCPAKASTLDTVAIEAGHSYVVSTGACKAGEAVTIEASSVDGLGLEFFEDWNPSSLGVYITAC